MDTVFWATLGFIFLSTTISAFVRSRSRDECLRLLHDHKVTLVMTDGGTVWGDLRVFSKGLQLRYSAPYRTRRGLVKSGYLLYHQEMGSVLALCRFTGGLNPEEARARQQQIDATFNPNTLRRMLRWWRNTLDTLRDAFTRAFSHALGQVTAKSGSAVLAANKKDVEGVGKTVLSVVGHAYEPILEEHIGQPVILELAPTKGGTERMEISGYLAEYTENFVALFNVEHEPGEMFTLVIEDDMPPEGVPEGVELVVGPTEVKVINRSYEILVVQSLMIGGDARRTLGASLVPGANLRFARPEGDAHLEMQWIAAADLVCPRMHATIRYKGPSLDAVADGIVPLHEDESVFFP